MPRKLKRSAFDISFELKDLAHDQGDLMEIGVGSG